mgnify:FL=1
MLTSEALLDRLRKASVPASAIQSIRDVADDAQVEAAGMLGAPESPPLEGYRDVALPLRIGGARPRGERATAEAGEQTVEVLGELG